MARHALLIAAGEYEDTTLSRLRAPAQDVERLAAVLEDPDIGGFDRVDVLRDVPDHQLRQAIEEIAADRLSDDLLLIYFSCHGIVDRLGRLYFATTNSQHGRPASTAVSSSFLNEQMEASLASAKVLMLDCCYSGAFAEGFKSAPSAVLDGRIGKGYIALSAADRYEFAFEGDSVVDSLPQASIFTDVVVEGLSTGNADLDRDGLVDIYELFRYVHDGVTRRNPNQTPRSWANDAAPNIYIAKAPRAASAMPLAGPVASANNFNRNQAVLIRGMRTASSLVRRTLGPLGQRTIFVDETGHHVEVTEAAQVAAMFHPDDPRDRLGATYIADIINDMHARAGDGAATAVILAQAMVDGAAVALRAGATPIALLRGIRAGAEVATRALTKEAAEVETKMGIVSVVTTASGDAALGHLIAEAMDKVGAEGVITVEEGNTLDLRLTIAEGMRFDKGYISPYFVTDPERLDAVLADPYVLLISGTLSEITPLLPLLEKVMPTGKPLLVIADQVEEEALTTLVVNKVRGNLSSCSVQAPGVGDLRTAVLNDIAVVTGGEVRNLKNLAQTELDSLGQARQAIITQHDTTLIEGWGHADAIHERINEIRRLVDTAPLGVDRDSHMERIGKIAGGVAVIQAGAVTEEELRHLTSRLKRAVRHGRLAVREGVVAGGGIAARRLKDPVNAAADDTVRGVGMRIVAAALEAPMTQLLLNAEITATPEHSKGFNVAEETIGDMFDLGIIEAAAVLRIALEAAVRTTEKFVMTV